MYYAPESTTEDEVLYEEKTQSPYVNMQQHNFENRGLIPITENSRSISEAYTQRRTSEYGSQGHERSTHNHIAEQTPKGQPIPPLPREFTISLNSQLQNKIQIDYASRHPSQDQRAPSKAFSTSSASSEVYDANARAGGNALGRLEKKID